MSLLSDIFGIKFGSKELTVQNPLPANDSIYISDIDFDNSDFTDWVGDSLVLFKSPFSTSIVNSTANNPKIIVLAFKRTVNAIQVGLGENNEGDFSNVKVSLLGSSGAERSVYDNQNNNTKKTSLNAVIGDELFNSIKLEFYTTDNVSLSNITIQKASYNVIENKVQNPIPVGSDSVYAKDINLLQSDIGDFSGSITDFFDDLHSESIDNTANNPKIIKFHFSRTMIGMLLGLGSAEGGSFSNVKVIGILSGHLETVLDDFSNDNTLRTSQTFRFPLSGINAVRIEFHTTNTISLTNVYIPKLIVVASVQENPIKYATSYKSPYLLNATNDNMNVAGSLGTPIDFKYLVGGLVPANWTRSFIDLEDGTQDFQPEDFGAITGGLTNGVQIIVVKDEIEYIMETWKTNMDISMTMFDFYSPYKLGGYIGRWTLINDLNSPITLFPDDEIICRIRDVLTSLEFFRFRTKLSQ